MNQSFTHKLSQYLPDISSIWGILFYSFFSYIVLYYFTKLLTEVIENQFDYDNFKKKIIKKRDVKAKEAQQLLNNITNSTNKKN